MVNIAILDVGHGDCSVIYNDDRSSVLIIDCNHGPTLIKFLDEQEISHVHLALITHNDEDHVKGICDLLHATRVDCLALHSTIKDDIGRTKRVLARLIEIAEQLASDGLLEMAILSTTDSRLEAKLRSLAFDTRLLYPDPNGSFFAKSSNSTSGIIRVEHGGVVVLFGGDLDSRGWDRIMKEDDGAGKLKAHIFRFPHHGGNLIQPRDRMDNTRLRGREYALKLLNAVQPLVTLISTSARENWEHPNPDVMEGIRDYGRSVAHRMLCTEVTTLCDAEFRAKRANAIDLLPIKHQSERVRSGSGHPCAGSIHVRVCDDGTFNIEPSALDHRAVVDLYPSHKCIAAS